ncbi:hypothetical protein ACFQZ4_20425 [Catellatospora coxensis]
MGNRLSSDVDLFTDSRQRADFTRAVDEVIAAFELQSLERITDTDFAEYQVSPERLAALRADFADWARVLRRSTT